MPRTASACRGLCSRCTQSSAAAQHHLRRLPNTDWVLTPQMQLSHGLLSPRQKQQSRAGRMQRTAGAERRPLHNRHGCASGWKGLAERQPQPQQSSHMRESRHPHQAGVQPQQVAVLLGAAARECLWCMPTALLGWTPCTPGEAAAHLLPSWGAHARVVLQRALAGRRDDGVRFSHYTTACCSTSNGHARVLGSGAGMAVAAASSGPLLAVVTVERKRKHFLSCFSIQVHTERLPWSWEVAGSDDVSLSPKTWHAWKAVSLAVRGSSTAGSATTSTLLMQANVLHFYGRAKLAAPQRSAEVASAALEGQRLALAWSDGTLQSVRISTAPAARVPPCSIIPISATQRTCFT